MVPIPAGEFMMGSGPSPRSKDEQPRHKVRLDAFWMQVHEVTWDEYRLFMFANRPARTRTKTSWWTPSAVPRALTSR